MFCSRTSSRVSRRIDFASSHAERLSLRRARFPDRRAPWYCLRVRCTRPVTCKRVRGSWTDHHSSWAVTAQPRHAVQLQIVDKLSTIGGPVSWLDKLAPTRYIRRADSLMFVGSFRPAGVLTEKELCLGRPLLLTFITVITVESIGEMLAKLETIPPVTMVEVAAVDLASFDQLCTEMGVRQ